MPGQRLCLLARLLSEQRLRCGRILYAWLASGGVAGFEQRDMHVRIAACGTRGPGAGNHIFDLFVGKIFLIKRALLPICEEAEPAFALGLSQEGSPFTDKPLGNALQVRTKIGSEWSMAHNPILFLLDILITSFPQIPGQFRTYPAILKQIPFLLQARFLPALTRVKDPRLERGIDGRETHGAKINIFDGQPPAREQIAPHGRKRLNWLGEILTDIRAEDGVDGTIGDREFFHGSLLVRNLALIPLSLAALLGCRQSRHRKIYTHNAPARTNCTRQQGRPEPGSATRVYNPTSTFEG